MSDRLAELAKRKQMLIARSRLHRLELQHGVGLLRQTLFAPRSWLAMATSGPVLPLIFSGLLMVAGGRRMGRVLRGAMAALAIVKALRNR